MLNIFKEWFQKPNKITVCDDFESIIHQPPHPRSTEHFPTIQDKNDEQERLEKIIDNYMVAYENNPYLYDKYDKMVEEHTILLDKPMNHKRFAVKERHTTMLNAMADECYAARDKINKERKYAEIECLKAKKAWRALENDINNYNT